MPLFHYKAVNRNGENVSGEREAADEAAMVLFLQQDGLLPVRIDLASNRWFLFARQKQKLSGKDVLLFTRELLTLLQAGLPLDRSFGVLVELTAHTPHLNGLVKQLLEAVKGGAQLSDALDRTNAFSRFYVNLIRAGETGGALDQVLERLADYLERSKELRDTVLSALIYPAILLTMAMLSLLLLLVFVVPQFTELFDSAGKALPVPTQIVVGVASAIRDYGWLAIPVFFLFSSYLRYHLADPIRRYAWDRRLLHLPLAGDLIQRLEVASFSRTLSTLLSNGVPLLNGLVIVKETLNNRYLAEQVEGAVRSLKQGGGLTSPLQEADIFPIMALQMIRLGEESGRLTEMLERVAFTYDKEVKIAVQRMLTLLEPLLIVGLGLVIGGIIMSILMAILSVNDLAF